MTRSAPGLRRLVEVVVLPALLPAVLALPVPLAAACSSPGRRSGSSAAGLLNDLVMRDDPQRP